MFSSNTTDFATIVGGPELVFHLDVANPQSYPGSGSTWYNLRDLSLASAGTLRDLTTTGTATTGPLYNSANSGSLLFDGTNDNASFTLPTILTNIANEDLTISIWIRILSLPGSNPFENIFGFTKSNSTPIYGARLCGSGTANLMQFVVIKNGTIYAKSGSIASYINQWVNIVGTFTNDPLSTTAGTVNLYINNVELTGGISGSPGVFGTNVINIAGRADNINDNRAYNNSYIQEVLVYRKVLTQRERLQNYNARRWRYGNY